MSVNGGTHRLSCNFPAIYNFGDSNSDTGGSSAAFWPANDPKGETFFHRPAGRGSDGRLIIDFMGMSVCCIYIYFIYVRKLRCLLIDIIDSQLFVLKNMFDIHCWIHFLSAIAFEMK